MRHPDILGTIGRTPVVRLALLAPIVAALGHEVIAREIDVEAVGPATARERPDVALGGLDAELRGGHVEPSRGGVASGK